MSAHDVKHEAKAGPPSGNSDKRRNQVLTVATIGVLVFTYLIYKTNAGKSSSGSSGATGTVMAGQGGNPGQENGQLVSLVSDNFQQLADGLRGVQKTQQDQQAYLNSIQMGTQMTVVGEQAIGSLLGNNWAVTGPQAWWQANYPTNMTPGAGWTIPGTGYVQPTGAPGSSPWPDTGGNGAPANIPAIGWGTAQQNPTTVGPSAN